MEDLAVPSPFAMNHLSLSTRALLLHVARSPGEACFFQSPALGEDSIKMAVKGGHFENKMADSNDVEILTREQHNSGKK